MKSSAGKPQNEKPQNTLAEKARLLHLRARTLSDSFHSGSSRSFYKGRGADFAGVREYLWGDDVRSIDWNVTARMGKPFIKRRSAAGKRRHRSGSSFARRIKTFKKPFSRRRYFGLPLRRL